MGFRTFYTEQKQLDEALIVLGKKQYPKFGNIVILAGGAGSGKGFILQRLLGIEGRVLDVDALKALAMKSELANKKFPELKNLNLKKSEDVFKLHDIVDKLGFADKRLQAHAQAIIAGDPARKPNIIFDVTLKNFKKVETIAAFADKLNYKKENIHIVWVLNDLDIAMEQNQKRDRVVPQNILIQTHVGAAKTMIDIMKSGDAIKKYANGDIIIAFNRIGKDSKVTIKVKRESPIKESNEILLSEEEKILTITKALYVKVKEQGKSMKNIKDAFKELAVKILNIVPAGAIKATEEWIRNIRRGNIVPKK